MTAFKKSISILLALLMITGVFAAVPVSASTYSIDKPTGFKFDGFSYSTYKYTFSWDVISSGYANVGVGYYFRYSEDGYNWESIDTKSNSSINIWLGMGVYYFQICPYTYWRDETGDVGECGSWDSDVYKFELNFENTKEIVEKDETSANNKKATPVKVSVKAKTVKLKKLKKKAQKFKVTVKAKTVKLKKLKKKAQKLKVITIKGAKGKVSCKITKAAKIKKFLKINSKGVITFKKWKKAKKGTYKVTVQITAKGNADYNSKKLVKTIKIKVKK